VFVAELVVIIPPAELTQTSASMLFSCAQEAPEHKITKEVKLSKRVIENGKIEPSPPRIVRSSPFSKLIGI